MGWFRDGRFVDGCRHCHGSYIEVSAIHPNQYSREPRPPVRADVRWDHLPSVLYVFLISCVYWAVLLQGSRPFYPGGCALGSICTFDNHGFTLPFCSWMTKSSCLTLHTVIGKIWCRKPPTSFFTFCPSIRSEVNRMSSFKVLICWSEMKVGFLLHVTSRNFKKWIKQRNSWISRGFRWAPFISKFPCLCSYGTGAKTWG